MKDFKFGSSHFVLPQVGTMLQIAGLGCLLITLTHCSRPSTTTAAVPPPVSQEVDSYTVSIQQWQEELNAQYRDPEHSPLPDLDRQVFTAHPFFPIDSTYRVVATLDYPAEVQVLEMPTSSGSIKTFEIYALANFELEGEALQLQVLKPFGRLSGLNNYLFIPFQDATSGQITYGGGRYMDLPLPAEREESLVIDFNRAYHPYCAYTDGYNCPIPPAENRLPISVQAGIKLP